MLKSVEAAQDDLSENPEPKYELFGPHAFNSSYNRVNGPQTDEDSCFRL